MYKPTKKSFREATKLPKIWNTIKCEIVKKYDNKLKKFVHYATVGNKHFKFIDSESDNSFEKQRATAYFLSKHV